MQQNQPVTIKQCAQYIFENLFQKQDPSQPDQFGIEIEMLPVQKNPTGKPTPIASSQLSSMLMDQLQNVKETKIFTENDKTFIEHMTLSDGSLLTFEPGGQFEFSSHTYKTAQELEKTLKSVQQTIDQVLHQQNMQLVHIGINPWHRLDEIGLSLPKYRYKMMDNYFSTWYPTSLRMMRQTLSVQICIDFHPNKEKALKRYLASILLVPFTSAIFAYSPILEGRIQKEKTVRNLVWRHTDPSRTGFPIVSLASCDVTLSCLAERYLDFALDAHVIYAPDLKFFLPNKLSFRNWMKYGINGVYPKFSDFKEHLSLLFPYIRPKGFIEIRNIDAQDRLWQLAPLALYEALIYNDSALDKVLALLKPEVEKIHLHALEADFGLANETIYKYGKKIFELAMEHSSNKILTAFYQKFTLRRRTPADDLMEQVIKEQSLSLTTLKRVQEAWEQVS